MEKTCAKGHTFFKTSSCPVCPVCEKQQKPQTGFLALVSAPARRALQGQGINSLEKLSELTEKELLALHGVGPSVLPKLRQALQEKGLAFRA